MNDDDRAIIKREMNNPKSVAYWKSPEFSRRWQELMHRLENETMTVEKAAKYLRVPVAVFRRAYAHRLMLDATGMSEADYKRALAECRMRQEWEN